MARRADPAKVWAAYRAGHDALRQWLGECPEPAWGRESVLAGWTVADLAAHIVAVATSVTALQTAPHRPRANSLAEYIAAYPTVADEVAATARDIAAEAEHQPQAILAAIDEGATAAARHVEGVGLRDQVVQARRGPIRLGDFLLTRAIEVVVHADDLARSVPEASSPKLPRETQRTAVRAFLDVLAERAPGHTVEIRVPPHAAVQCVEGPRHTRGTPPNVVEMDAATWIRLAAGRAQWGDEVSAGRVSASGERADLAGYLPLL